MIKNKILLNFKEEDRADVLSLYDKYVLAKERYITIFSNSFYPPNVWKYFKERFETKDFSIEVFGIFEDAERRMICFNNIYNTSFPIRVIKIENKSKFNNLTHRDYLGTVLSLGIKRNKIGDLLVKDKICFMPVYDEIEEYISNSLSVVGGAPCTLSVVEEDDVVLRVEFEEFVILVQSLRIDSIISKIVNISRGKAQSLIKDGKVLIDYNITRDKSSEVICGQRITIRGAGKFIIDESIGNSKSGKIRINMKKYI